MKKIALILAAAVVAAGCSTRRAVDPVEATTLQSGMWTGQMTWTESGRPQGIIGSYDVTVNGETIGIVMRADGGPLPFSDVKLNGNTLTFWATPGARAFCTLTRRDDGAFEGPCKAERNPESSTLRVLMVPPKKN
jgi:hypothetical protein